MKQSRLSPWRRSGLLRGACHQAALRADPLAHNDEERSYCPVLIAQVTLTDTDSVSSPCAIGVGAAAAMGKAILPRNTGCGAPSSEMLKGAPSVTPAALA